MKSLQRILLVASQDITTELKSKQMLFSNGLFVLLTLLIFHIGLGDEKIGFTVLGPGILWAIISFSGVIVLSHLGSHGESSEVNTGLLLSGMSAMELYFGKLLATVVFLFAFEAFIIPMFLLFFGFGVGNWLLLFLPILILATLGYASIGTLFANILNHARFRDLLLPVILYPFIIPLLIVALTGTQACFEERETNAFVILLGYDLIFLTASAFLFEFVVEDTK